MHAWSLIYDEQDEKCTKLPLNYTRVQWNLSIVDTLGTAKHVLISEVSLFQG